MDGVISLAGALATADAEHSLTLGQVRALAQGFEDFNFSRPQVELEVIIHHSPGIHARELRIPAGVELSGAVHLFENLNILSGGTMDLLTENGIERVTAPFTCVSPPGTKRIARAVTDCVWTTILGTDELDEQKIAEQFTTKNEASYLALIKQNMIKE